MIDCCARVGYPSVTVAALSSHAGVSSATFHELFEDREGCLLAAYRTAAERVLEEIWPGVGAGDCSTAVRGALHQLLLAAQQHPAAGRVLLVEARAAGPQLREERLHILERFEGAIDRFLDQAKPLGETLDVPAVALVGGIGALIDKYLALQAADDLPAIEGALMAWIDSYTVPAAAPRFSTGASATLDNALPASEAFTTNPSARLSRGSDRFPLGTELGRRTRLIQATAAVTMSKGYAETTVADIVASAGFSLNVFYEHFTSKEHAFAEAQQHATQHVLDECAKAFFGDKPWPERVWDGLHTLIALILSNPAISHLRLVECYSAGPAAIRRAQEITRSFTMFLEEGYSYGARELALPRICSEAIAGATFEIVQRHVARGEGEALQRALPQLVYIAIAPFTGPGQAARLVQQLSARAEPARATPEAEHR